MRNLMKLTGSAVLVILTTVGAASAQTVIQPNYQPGGGSGQSFVYQPGSSAETNMASRPLGSSMQGSQGPVTGYGAGGMAHVPGTPPDAPYSHGGIGGHGR